MFKSAVEIWKISHLVNVLLGVLLLQKQVSLNMFLDTFMSDHPPQCLVWLPLMHRLANVENGELFIIFSGQNIWPLYKKHPYPLNVHTIIRVANYVAAE